MAIGRAQRLATNKTVLIGLKLTNLFALKQSISFCLNKLLHYRQFFASKSVRASNLPDEESNHPNLVTDCTVKRIPPDCDCKTGPYFYSVNITVRMASGSHIYKELFKPLIFTSLHNPKS